MLLRSKTKRNRAIARKRQAMIMFMGSWAAVCEAHQSSASEQANQGFALLAFSGAEKRAQKQAWSKPRFVRAKREAAHHALYNPNIFLITSTKGGRKTIKVAITPVSWYFIN